MFALPQSQRLAALVGLAAVAAGAANAQQAVTSAAFTEAGCNSPALAATVPVDRIGERVSAVVLDSLTWVAAAQDTPPPDSGHAASIAGG